MHKFTVLDGLVVPLDRANVDTDAIIPKQFLKSIKRAGFGPNLFDEWRYLDHGEPGMDPATRQPNPEFVLNFPRYRGASVLLARENFGCGSSREHAPWALEDYGIRAIIAPSFSDIYSGNMLQNGLLPVVLPQAVCDDLRAQLRASPGAQITIDLEAKKVTAPDGAQHAFDIDLILAYTSEIEAFERRYLEENPWRQPA